MRVIPSADPMLGVRLDTTMLTSHLFPALHNLPVAAQSSVRMINALGERRRMAKERRAAAERERAAQQGGEGEGGGNAVAVQTTVLVEEVNVDLSVIRSADAYVAGGTEAGQEGGPGTA